MPFCKCGCGREVSKAENRFISGHNWKGKKLNKNTIEKLKELQLGESNSFYGKKHSTQSRKKMSESRKGKISHRKGKNIPTEVIEKIRKKHIENGKNSWKKKYYENNLPIYESYSKKLTVEELPKRDKKDKNLLTVICTNCKKRFIPSLRSVVNRVRSLKGSQGGESRLYCSEKCKYTCTIYRKISLQNDHPSIKNYTDEEYQTFRRFVLERDGYICQFCGEAGIDVHHERAQKLEPFFSLDPDFAWSVCKKCHYKYGHKDECSTGNLSKKIC